MAAPGKGGWMTDGGVRRLVCACVLNAVRALQQDDPTERDLALTWLLGEGGQWLDALDIIAPDDLARIIANPLPLPGQLLGRRRQSNEFYGDVPRGIIGLVRRAVDEWDLKHGGARDLEFNAHAGGE